MKADIKQRWLDAMRSGKYPKGTHTLRKRYSEPELDTYCCLGVLCDLAEQDGIIQSGADGGVTYYGVGEPGDLEYDRTTGVLPSAVVQWAGLPDNNPTLEMEELGQVKKNNLSYINDHTHALKPDFTEIADLIEQYIPITQENPIVTNPFTAQLNDDLTPITTAQENTIVTNPNTFNPDTEVVLPLTEVGILRGKAEKVDQLQLTVDQMYSRVRNANAKYRSILSDLWEWADENSMTTEMTEFLENHDLPTGERRFRFEISATITVMVEKDGTNADNAWDLVDSDDVITAINDGEYNSYSVNYDRDDEEEIDGDNAAPDFGLVTII